MTTDTAAEKDIKGAEWLRAARLLCGFSQTELAKQAGLSLAMVQALEQGSRTGSAVTWSKLVRVLGCDVDQVLSSLAVDWATEIDAMIENFGAECLCHLSYRIVNNTVYFTGYEIAAIGFDLETIYSLREGDIIICTLAQVQAFFKAQRERT